MRDVTKKVETSEGSLEVRLRETTPHEYEVTVMDDDYVAAPFAMQKRDGLWGIVNASGLAFWLTGLEGILQELITENFPV